MNNLIRDTLQKGCCTPSILANPSEETMPFSSRQEALASRAPIAAAVIETLEQRCLLSSTLLPISNLRDLVLDDTHDILYATNGSNVLYRINAATKSLMTSLTVGNSLRGIDITPDD